VRKVSSCHVITSMVIVWPS